MYGPNPACSLAKNGFYIVSHWKKNSKENDYSTTCEKHEIQMLESIVRFHWNTAPAVPLLIVCGGFLHTRNSRAEQVQLKPYSPLGHNLLFGSWQKSLPVLVLMGSLINEGKLILQNVLLVLLEFFCSEGDSL